MYIRFNLKHLSIYIALITAVSGAAQILFPNQMLSFVSNTSEVGNLFSSHEATQAIHFFRILGMFMFILGAMLCQSICFDQGQNIITIWSGIYKLGASIAISYGVYIKVFTTVAIFVAVFEAVSMIIIFMYYTRNDNVIL